MNHPRLTVLLLLLIVGAGRADDHGHWAYQAIVRPEAQNLDLLIDAKLRARGLRARGPAAKEHLLRRVHLNLTGLAPTRPELHAFLKDDSKDAYELVVDRLLASEHYGERWGRHWLDVWRYSDWYGLGKQLRVSQKHMWRWRDWVVNSLNSDKGYDRMILEMLAGDELDPTNQEVVAGTGFLARNYYLFNRTTWLDNTIEHTAKAFLGMTMNCVKCHEHKYDPIPAADYYRFRAIFEPHQVRLDAVPGESDFEKDGLPRVFDDHVEEVTYLHLKGNAATPDKSRQIQPGVPALFPGLNYEPEAIDLPAFAYAPGTRDYVVQAALKKQKVSIAKAAKSLARARTALAGFTDAKTNPTEPVIFDDFETERLDLWRKLGKDWVYRDAMLVRHTAARADYLTGKFAYPDDFQVTIKYRTTGGTTYKSIGLRFDMSADGKIYNQVYTSAHAPGAKVQVSYQRKGRASYPPSGRKARKIEIGHLYELRVMVRDRLVNVFLDDEFQLAYELPTREAEGVMELSAFDATCEFHSFELRELPEYVRLAKPGEKAGPAAPQSREGLAALVELAQLDVRRQEKKLESLQARIAADREVATANGRDSQSAIRRAARTEAEAKLLENEYLLQRDREKADKKKIAQYKKAIADTRRNLKSPGTNYTSIAGSLKALETPEHKFGNYAEMYSRRSTGRRLALAKWIIDKRNPLTARVAVNHIWMRHFGAPLVESVFDFGPRAKKPVHQDVLDWLASELMAHDWSMKHLHRLIVLSEAYRRTSSSLGADAATKGGDPANAYYWRMNPRRMESQIVRDNLLHLSGTLDRSVGGTSIAANAKSSRRSIYFRHGRDDVQKFLSMFDDADFLQCYRRSESVVPQQALALSNSAEALASAEKIADDLGEEFVVEAFEIVLGRKPSHYEIAECEAFLREMEKVNGADKKVRLVHALLNHNDFVTIR